MNINNFSSQINQTNGVALQHQFIALVEAPIGLETADLGIDNRHFAFRVDSFEYPGRSVVNVEYPEYGPGRSVGGGTAILETTMSVILSADMREREFFMRWQDLIVGNYRTGEVNDNRFNLGYFDDYKSDGIQIRQFDQSSQSIENYLHKVTLIDAYPQLVGNIAATWSSSEIQRINIAWKYRFFIDEARIKAGDGSIRNPVNRTLDRVFSVIAGQVIGDIVEDNL